MIVPIHSLSYAADTYFYVHADSANKHATLMARKPTETTSRPLLDLDILASGKPMSEVEIQPSGDGKYVAIGVSPAREGYSIRILDVATGALLPDSIVRSFDGDASWGDSNKAFYYRQVQQARSGGAPASIFTNMWPRVLRSDMASFIGRTRTDETTRNSPGRLRAGLHYL